MKKYLISLLGAYKYKKLSIISSWNLCVFEEEKMYRIKRVF